MHFISILGFDRSGTTFLGNYISQFPEKAFYAGEIDKGLEKYFSGAMELCSCGRSYEECEVWSRILPHLKDEMDLSTLLEKLKEVTGAEVIIDSSKKKGYIKKFSSLFKQKDYSVLHIVRDPRAVALSRTKNRKKRLKKNTHPKPYIAKLTNLMMYYDSLEWNIDNIWMENFKKGFKQKKLIYERLDESTATEIKDFLKENDLRLGHSALENHMLWGSSNTRMAKSSKIKINMSWKQELNVVQKGIINFLSFPVRKSFKYKFDQPQT